MHRLKIIFTLKVQRDLMFNIELSLQENFNTLANYLKLLIQTLMGYWLLSHILLWLANSTQYAIIHLINKVYHRTFRMVYNQYEKSYKDLQPNNNASIHQKQERHLAFQIFLISYASKFRIYVVLLLQKPYSL